MNNIPRISLSSLEKLDTQTINDLNYALERTGFFVLYNHKINTNLIKDCYQKSKDFFNLNINIKNQYAHPEIGGARGYTPFGKETALGENVPDLKEFWHHGPILDNFFDPRVYDNIKIKEVDDFNSVFDQLFNDLNNLGSDLLSFIAISINLNKSY